MVETVDRIMDGHMVEPVVGTVSDLAGMDVAVGGVEVPLVPWLRRQVGKGIKELRGLDGAGEEGPLRCKSGHAGPWRLLRVVGGRFDLQCQAVLVNRQTGERRPCGKRGTAYAFERPVPFQGQGGANLKYATLARVVLSLGERPGVSAGQLAALAGLSLGQVNGCLARLLRRGLVASAPAMLIPTGRKTRVFSLTESGLAYYRYYGGAS